MNIGMSKYFQIILTSGTTFVYRKHMLLGVDCPHLKSYIMAGAQKYMYDIIPCVSFSRFSRARAHLRVTCKLSHHAVIHPNPSIVAADIFLVISIKLNNAL